MAKDDFIRIKYTREAEGRKKRSSISIDPDLFQIFAKVRGNVPAARAVLREWAMEIDAGRQWGEDSNIGASRLVQRRMFADINEFVDKGLVVAEQEDANRHPYAPKPERKRAAGRKGADVEKPVAA